MALAIGPRMQKVVKALGFVVLALIALLFFLQMTFPYARVKDRMVDALSNKYEVSVGAVRRGLGQVGGSRGCPPRGGHQVKSREIASK